MNIATILSNADQRTENYTTYVMLLGLLGGDHFPSCSSTMDGVRDDEEVIEKPDGKDLKRKSDSEDVDTSSSPPKKKAGCVITSPGNGFLRVAEDENDNVEEDDSMDKAEAVDTQTVRKKTKEGCC